MHDGVYVCRHITYIATGIFNTSACCNVGKRYPPHDIMNCCIFQLWCRLGATQLRVGLQSTIGAHQEK